MLAVPSGGQTAPVLAVGVLGVTDMAGLRGGLLALCALVAGLAACGSSGPGTTPVGPPSATASAAELPPSPAPSLPAEADLVGGVQAQDLCAFFGSDLPRLRDQSTVGTLARLAADVGDFYAAQGLPRPDGVVIDEALRRTCPDVRLATLVAVGRPDLRSL